ncbi:MAG: hypothetical protein ACRCWR_05150 [Saezia sp.]
MKKLLIALLCMVWLAGCAHDPYKIDPEATAHAPWKVGEIAYQFSVFKGDQFMPMLMEMSPDTAIDRVFLGKTVDGYYVVQEFFATGEPASNPILIVGEEGVAHETSIKHGHVLSWYPTGEKAEECLLEQGRSVHPCLMWYKNGEKMWEYSTLNGMLHGQSMSWYPNGQKLIESEFSMNKAVGVSRVWDIHGNLIDEINNDL